MEIEIGMEIEMILGRCMEIVVGMIFDMEIEIERKWKQNNGNSNWNRNDSCSKKNYSKQNKFSKNRKQ